MPWAYGMAAAPAAPPACPRSKYHAYRPQRFAIARPKPTLCRVHTLREILSASPYRPCAGSHFYAFGASCWWLPLEFKFELQQLTVRHSTLVVRVRRRENVRRADRVACGSRGVFAGGCSGRERLRCIGAG